MAVKSTITNLDQLVKEELERERKAQAAFVLSEEVLHLQELYTKAIESCPKSFGNSISSKARKDNPTIYTGCSFVYGEIMFEPFAITIDKIRKLYGGLTYPGKDIFYDLGSGTGKPVLAASLLHQWGACKGVELVTDLYNVSLSLGEEWGRNVVPSLPPPLNCPIQFFNDDITTFDLSDATVLFANSTCFDRPLMLRIAANVRNLKLGTFLVTFTKDLPCPNKLWTIREHQTYNMSWGPATVYIQEKTAMPPQEERRQSELEEDSEK